MYGSDYTKIGISFAHKCQAKVEMAGTHFIVRLYMSINLDQGILKGEVSLYH